jgi:WD40 repeat protein/tetratricopeptide (TPR) repeat protein
VEARKRSDGPEVLPSNFYGVKDLQFAHAGSILVATHLDGKLSIWSVETGRRTFLAGDPTDKVMDAVLLRDFPATVAARFSNGAIRTYRVLADGTTSAERIYPGPFAGLTANQRGSAATAWAKDGSALALRGQAPTNRIARADETVSSCAVSADGKMLAVLLSKGLRIFRAGTAAPVEIALGSQPKTTDLAISGRLAGTKVFLVEGLNAAIVTVGGDESSATVIDLAGGRVAWMSRETNGIFAVDQAGGKLAALDAGNIEQWILSRTGEHLQVQSAGKWRVDAYRTDAGEAQALAYGPYGEYLLSANSPIMTLVGPVAATVRLWYANDAKDNRVGDVHRGKTIGPSDVAVLNVCFDDEGSRLAIFATDGSVHIWDVFPEQAVNPSQRAKDFFANFWHLAPFGRELLGEVREDPKSTVMRAEMAYRVRLSDGDSAALDNALAGQGNDTDSILRSLAKPTPSTIALQNFGDRDEVPNLRLGAKARLVGYDLRSNPGLAEIVDAVSNGHAIDTNLLGRLWLNVVEDDLGLLAGVRIASYLHQLESGDAAARCQAYVLLALSGDTSQLAAFEARAKSEAPGQARTAAEWAVQFLSHTGRDLSLNGPPARRPDGDPLWKFLSLPQPFLQLPEAAAVTQLPWDGRAAAELLAAAQSDGDAGKSISLLAAATYATGADEFYSKMNMAVMLRDSNALDSALAWIKPLVGRKNKAGRGGDPENLMGHILHLKGADQEALPWFALATARGRKDGWPERNAGAALAALGRTREAVAQYEAALSIRRDLTRRIQDLKDRLKPEEFQEAVAQANSELADFLNGSAWNSVISSDSASDLNRALTLSVESCELTGYRNWNYIDTQAHIDARLGAYSKAVELEQRAVALLPDGSDDKSKALSKIVEWKAAVGQR